MIYSYLSNFWVTVHSVVFKLPLGNSIRADQKVAFKNGLIYVADGNWELF